MTRSVARRHVAAIGLAVIAAIGLLGTPVGPTAPVDTRAATPDLTITSATRYDVQPDRRRVRVVADLTVTNHLRDTTTKRFYFDEAFLAILPGTSGFRLTTEGSGDPSVSATRRPRSHTLLRLDLGKRLYSGKSATYRLTFNLNDPGGAATRDVRIGDSLASFPVWAFASDSTPGSSVTVVVPKGFEVRVEAGAIPDPTTDDRGRTVFRSGRLAKPLDFFAYLVADRPGSYVEATLQPEVLGAPAEVMVRSWPDDKPWAKRVTRLLDRGLPALGERIGLPWPRTDTLTVQEALSRNTGGYAGLFDPSAGRIEIAYYAGDFVVLHEAAHSWFNGSLLADRWANEAFASYYAEATAKDLKVKVKPDKLTKALQAARIPLNGWGPVGSEDPRQEDYAYAAGLTLAREIAKRAGTDGLQAVWADAAARTGAYQPVGGPAEVVEGPPDWRGLLDLLEERTDASYDDLWRAWIARPTDLALLDARAAARRALTDVEAATDGWRLPRPIRDAMRAWRFADASRLIAHAEAALVQRTQVVAAADRAGLIAPDALRTAFEDDDGFDDALTEASLELDTIDRFQEAVDRRPTTTSPILALGLWGLTPEDDLADARDAFAEGDLEASVAASHRAAETWTHAETTGKSRALSIGLLILAAVLGIGSLIVAWRRRRRRRRRRVLVQAHPIGD